MLECFVLNIQPESWNNFRTKWGGNDKNLQIISVSFICCKKIIDKSYNCTIMVMIRASEVLLGDFFMEAHFLNRVLALDEGEC